MSRFTMFGAASLDCNHLEGLQKAKKLETLYGFGSHHLWIKKIYMGDLWQILTIRQWNITKLGKLSSFHLIFLMMGFIFEYDASDLHYMVGTLHETNLNISHISSLALRNLGVSLDM